jgi:hypothetical protein
LIGVEVDDYFEMTDEQVSEGILHSRRNAIRLARDAAVLLKHGATHASIYGLWHLAVEELGKSIILHQGLDSGNLGKRNIPRNIFRGQHEAKFRAGLELLPKTRATKMGFSVTVTRNSSTSVITVHDPRGGGSVSVVQGMTGRYKDVTPGAGTPPSHDLRLQLLYVDFDGSNWIVPENELINAALHAKATISAEELGLVISELNSVLEQNGVPA